MQLEFTEVCTRWDKAKQEALQKWACLTSRSILVTLQGVQLTFNGQQQQWWLMHSR